MTLNGRPINTNSREYIELMKELEHDAEILATPASLQTVQSWPASSESTPPEVDALLCTEALGLPGVPYAERPERTDEPAAVSLGAFLRVRQAV